MAERIFRLTNGVSFGARYTVTAADATNNEITFVFKGVGENAVDYPLAATFQIVTAANVHVPLTDAVITYPADGKVKIAEGGTFALTAGWIITVVAQRADIVAE